MFKQLRYRIALWRRDRVERGLNGLVQEVIKLVRSEVAKMPPPIVTTFSYGAIGIDPKHLVIWFGFKTDRQMAEAQSNGLCDLIEKITRRKLEARGYPKPQEAHIGFVSDEDVQREADGNYYHYFK